METGSGSHGMTLFTTGNIPYMNEFINGVPRCTFSTWFFTIPTHNMTFELLKCSRKSIVYEKLYRLVYCDTEILFWLISRSWRAIHSKEGIVYNFEARPWSEGIYLSVISIKVSHWIMFSVSVGFAKKATVANVTWKWHSLANRTDEADPTHPNYFLKVFSIEMSEEPVNCKEILGSSIVGFLDFRISAWCLLLVPLFRWFLLYEALICKALSFNFPEGTRFGVFLLLVFWHVGREDLFWVTVGDLALLQHILDEAHHLSQLSKFAGHKNWFTWGIFVCSFVCWGSSDSPVCAVIRLSTPHMIQPSRMMFEYLMNIVRCYVMKKWHSLRRSNCQYIWFNHTFLSDGKSFSCWVTQFCLPWDPMSSAKILVFDFRCWQ